MRHDILTEEIPPDGRNLNSAEVAALTAEGVTCSTLYTIWPNNSDSEYGIMSKPLSSTERWIGGYEDKRTNTMLGMKRKERAQMGWR